MASSAPLLMIAAGGTGGHMFPAQALAEAMLRLGWRVVLTTDERGARYTGGFPHVVEIRTLASATFARGGLAAKLAAPFRIAAGILSATMQMLRDRPAVVVGFGGYPSIPAMAAAWLTGRPRMIHEQNGVLGRVNRVFARRVHRVACGTWPTELPAGVRGENTGNPVRAAVLERAGTPYHEPNDAPVRILVMGGSQGARILSQTVPAALAALPDEWRGALSVAHQAREEDAEAARATYAQAGIEAEVEPFFRDIARRIAEAQLVISRAGASSVADISVIGRPSILVPFAAAAGDHQTANARGLADAGAAVVIPESRLTPEVLSEHIALILGDPESAARMARAARGYGKPDATDHLVALVQTLAGDRAK